MANDYDTEYKQLFSHPEMVRDLLAGFAPHPWAARLDVSAFERVNASYVSDSGRQRHDDMVWKLWLGDEWMVLYLLLEFQSSNDPWMALRMQIYVGLLCQDLIKRRELTPRGKLPLLLPVVFYNGTARWSASADLSTLMTAAPPELAPLQPQQRQQYLLIDKNCLQPAAAATNLVAALFRLEHSRTWRDIHDVVTNLAAWLGEPRHIPLRASLARWIRACLRRQLKRFRIPEVSDLSEVETMIAQEFETWADELEYKGMQKGMQKGLQKGRQEGLEEGRREGQLQADRARLQLLLQQRFGDLPAVIAARIAAAPPPQLEQWFKQLFKAGSLADMFAAQ